MVVYTSVSYTDKKRARNKRLKRYLALLLCVLLAFGAAYLLFFTDIFRFKEIKVVGEGIADISWFPPHPFYWQSLQVHNPHLALVSVQKSFFRKTIVLSVKEREKQGVWCGVKVSAGDVEGQAARTTKCLWFDKEGVLFREAPSVDGTLIPVIKEFSSHERRVGESLLSASSTQYVLKIFDIFKEADIALVGLRMEDGKSDEVIADLLGEVEVYFSTRFDSSFALPALAQLKPKLRKLSYIDFRSQNRVYYR
jgi:hypothetical protein